MTHLWVLHARVIADANVQQVAQLRDHVEVGERDAHLGAADKVVAIHTLHYPVNAALHCVGTENSKVSCRVIVWLPIYISGLVQGFQEGCLRR